MKYSISESDYIEARDSGTSWVGPISNELRNVYWKYCRGMNLEPNHINLLSFMITIQNEIEKAKAFLQKEVA